MNSNFTNKIISGNRFIKGTPGSEIDSRIKIINNYIFSKDKSDTLSNPELCNFLKQNNISEIIIVGLDAAGCVYKPAIGAIRRGYKAAVIKDAIITSKMEKMPQILDIYEKRGILLTSLDDFMSLKKTAK
jgi:nicotinamidase/pyrazinamidase